MVALKKHKPLYQLPLSALVKELFIAAQVVTLNNLGDC
jgi:hypothetical protein